MGFLAAARRNHFLNERRIEERGGRETVGANQRPTEVEKEGGDAYLAKDSSIVGGKGGEGRIQN